MRKHPIVSSIAAFVVLASVVGAAAGSSHKSTGPTSSPALVTTTTGPAPAASKPAAQPQTFKGTGTENIGTVNVSTDSTLRWSCATCSNDNFVISNDVVADTNTIAVNGLDQTNGKTVINAGTYHKVEIDTEGQDWSFTITPGT
jgi:hypothetical protein